MQSIHRTVLLNEAIDGLNLKANSTVVDATFGGGGHSAEICRRSPSAKIIALDQDKSVSKNKASSCNIIFYNENFRNLDKVLEKDEKVNGIVEARNQKKIETTFELVKIISKSVPGVYKRGRLHYATKTFQAIRIAVNDELEALAEGLNKGFEALKVGGKMSVISFHSLEDRIVKRFYKKQASEWKAKLINKKPIKASAEEIKNNPRSRSAKLRILEKIK